MEHMHSDMWLCPKGLKPLTALEHIPSIPDILEFCNTRLPLKSCSQFSTSCHHSEDWRIDSRGCSVL